MFLSPTERNKLTLAWGGPYKIAGAVREVDCKTEVDRGMVQTRDDHGNGIPIPIENHPVLEREWPLFP